MDAMDAMDATWDSYAETNVEQLLARNKPQINHFKRRTTSQLVPARFCDYLGQVLYYRHEPTRVGDTATLIMTDYTEHDSLPLQRTENKPIGKACLVVTLWDEHARQSSTMDITIGTFLLLKNVVSKLDNHGTIQLNMNGYRPDKRLYQVNDPITILTAQDPLVHPLRLRKSRYEMDYAACINSHRLSKPALSGNVKREFPPTPAPETAPAAPPTLNPLDRLGAISPHLTNTKQEDSKTALFGEIIRTSNGQNECNPEYLKSELEGQVARPSPVSTNRSNIDPTLDSTAVIAQIPPTIASPVSDTQHAQASAHLSNTHKHIKSAEMPQCESVHNNEHDRQNPMHTVTTRNYTECQHPVAAAACSHCPLPNQSESPTEILVEQIKSDQKNGKGKKPYELRLIRIRARVAGFLPKNINHFSVPVCSNCKYHYGPSQANNLPLDCPQCSLQNRVKFEYKFTLNLLDEFDQLITVSVDDFEAKTLLGIDFDPLNMSKPSSKTKRILKRLSLIGVRPNRHNETSSIVFDCCIRVSRTTPNSGSINDEVAIRRITHRTEPLEQEDTKTEDLLVKKRKSSGNVDSLSSKQKQAKLQVGERTGTIDMETFSPCSTGGYHAGYHAMLVFTSIK